MNAAAQTARVLFIFIGAAQVPILALLFARHVHTEIRAGRKWFELSIHKPTRSRLRFVPQHEVPRKELRLVPESGPRIQLVTLTDALPNALGVFQPEVVVVQSEPLFYFCPGLRGRVADIPLL